MTGRWPQRAISSGDSLWLFAWLIRDNAARYCMNFSSRPSLFVNRAQDRQLIVVVVNGELRREAGAKVGQRRAIAPQQSNAERMKRRNHRAVACGCRRPSIDADQSPHAIAHFARGFVGERDREDRPAGDAMHRHQMGDAMRDHARFAAACAGQDQQGAFDVLNGFALAGSAAPENP